MKLMSTSQTKAARIFVPHPDTISFSGRQLCTCFERKTKPMQKNLSTVNTNSCTKYRKAIFSLNTYSIHNFGAAFVPH